jgi:hypothetical protein
VLVLALLGVGAWAVTASSEDPQVLVEAADSVGPDPFTTAGITLASATVTTTASPGLYGGSGDNGVCSPAALAEFLGSHPEKARAWVGALNADPDLSWSGGELAVSDIGRYITTLSPAVLSQDTRVTNHGFRDGTATRRVAVLKKGTAVLVDGKGVPRVRCFCGNPLHGLPAASTSTAASDPPTTSAPEPSSTAGPTPAAEPSAEASCFYAPDTDGCGPEPTDPECVVPQPLPEGISDETTAPGNFDGDGSPDVLRVYRSSGAWHARIEIGGNPVADVVLAGSGPMTAVGGASVDAVPVDEAWVKVGTTPGKDVLGLLTLLGCELHRVSLEGTPAELPVGGTSTTADGVACFGFDVGLEVFTTTSTDGVTYTGTSSIYTIDYGNVPPTLVLGSTAAQSQTTSDGASYDALHTFQCDDLSVIP